MSKPRGMTSKEMKKNNARNKRLKRADDLVVIICGSLLLLCIVVILCQSRRICVTELEVLVDDTFIGTYISIATGGLIAIFGRNAVLKRLNQFKVISWSLILISLFTVATAIAQYLLLNSFGKLLSLFSLACISALINLMCSAITNISDRSELRATKQRRTEKDARRR